MFHGPSFIVSTMQEETTPTSKRLWYDWTQQQLGIEPTNPLGQCWVPPIVAFYDQQGLLRTYSLPGGFIRSPHPGSPLHDMNMYGNCKALLRKHSFIAITSIVSSKNHVPRTNLSLQLLCPIWNILMLLPSKFVCLRD